MEKCAIVLAHKLSEAMSHETKNPMLSGEVEIGGAYFGGTVPLRTAKRIARTSASRNTGPASAVSSSPCANAMAVPSHTLPSACPRAWR